jgi:membrane fusion protein, multidrug efflux system
MAHFESTDLNKPAAPERVGVSAPPAKSRWWLWLLVVGVLVIGIWYYRGSHNEAEAESKNAGATAPGGAGGGKGGRGGAGGGAPVIPVVVATAQHGDLPVYFTGLGTVTAFNTVTVHSRVDGQLVSVAFKEGQFVH